LVKVPRVRRILPVLLAVAVCGMSPQAAESNKIKIGFSIEAMKGERWQTDLESFEARARELGAEVISRDANGDDELQLRQVQEMIKAGVKVLVLLPHDTKKATRMVEEAKAARVKVISYDRLIQDSNVDLFVGFDRVEIGRMQAEYLAEHAPKGNYVLIAGSPNDEGAKTLHDTQMKVLQPYIDRGDIRVIADAYTKEWLPSEAYLQMLKTIESSQDEIAAVVASNDGMAGGVIQALREHNLAGKVLVSGQDADLASIICIVQGAQAMTVYKPISKEAVRAAEEAIHLAKGEEPRTNGRVNNGTVEVPAVMLKPVLVTNGNLKETVVKDGFQTLKRINEGLPKEQQIR
jgi:D-xylose transport system substrate-binding protein